MTVKLTIVRAPACDWFILSGLKMEDEQAEQMAKILRGDDTRPAMLMTLDQALEHQIIDLSEPRQSN